MSLLSVVERAIETSKAEQAEINASIQLYRDILQTLTPQPKTVFEESECADDPAADTDTSPGEKEDIELLERALEKALRIRTGTGVSKKDHDRNKKSAPQKEPATTVVEFKEGMQASAASKANQTTKRSTSKSAGIDKKEHKKPGASVSSMLGPKSAAGYHSEQSKTIINRNIILNCPVSSVGIVHQHTARKSQQTFSTSDSLDQLPTSTLHSKNKTFRSNVLSGKAAAFSTPSLNNTVPVSHSEVSGVHSVPRKNGVASDQTAKWKSLRSKQNRLWEKVVALQRKPVSGRSHFMERMRATFPKDWPCGSPDQTRALVDRLTRQGRDLTQHYQMKELLAKQTPEAATQLVGKENKHDSCLTLERLQMTAAVLHDFADRVTKEWEAWDRWRPEGGCLCPTGANGVCGDGLITPLPLTITYTTEAELRELEKLRMRVALLQQEIYLEQALLDTLSPQLSSIVPGPGCPNVGVLRDMYSLLGEGGERFPAIVLDTEPD
ncbi:tubulin epsilon and delta complex protein 2 isoform X2 [Micropterus dolomieu]|nr:tubulin epsilon and delta complex protein 2 isoform X2 [Micropterus dolomieu]XP_045886890.1 tubulin epsilon and delta complex protein 2 isoform X2 [Micropterus dolomieu]